MGLGDPLHQREAEPAPGGLGGEEGFEDLGEELLRDSDPFVSNRNRHDLLPLPRFAPYADPQRATLGHRLHPVLHQVEEGLAKKAASTFTKGSSGSTSKRISLPGSAGKVAASSETSAPRSVQPGWMGLGREKVEENVHDAIEAIGLLGDDLQEGLHVALGPDESLESELIEVTITPRGLRTS